MTNVKQVTYTCILISKEDIAMHSFQSISHSPKSCMRFQNQLHFLIFTISRLQKPIKVVGVSSCTQYVVKEMILEMVLDFQ